MIRFPCPHCGAKLQVSDTHAGKEGPCPRCKKPLVVPDSSPPRLSLELSPLEAARTAPSIKAHDSALLDLRKDGPQVQTNSDKLEQDPVLSALGSYDAYQPSAQEQAEHSGKRSLPWPVDIFLYPLNVAGLTTLGIVIVIPMLINLVVGLAGPFGFFIAIPGSIISMVLRLYFLWYVPQCIADSALGGVRAPETVAQAPGLWDIVTQVARTLACLAVALLPLMVYWLSARTIDAVYWSLLVWAVAICPMALLAVAMFDSIVGLNPLILIGSVFSTFLPYLGLVLILGSMVFLVVNVSQALADHPLLGFAFSLVEYHLILIAAHLLGRFYWRYSEKLNWDV